MIYVQHSWSIPWRCSAEYLKWEKSKNFIATGRWSNLTLIKFLSRIIAWLGSGIKRQHTEKKDPVQAWWYGREQSEEAMEEYSRDNLPDHWLCCTKRPRTLAKSIPARCRHIGPDPWLETFLPDWLCQIEAANPAVDLAPVNTSHYWSPSRYLSGQRNEDLDTAPCIDVKCPIWPLSALQ